YSDAGDFVILSGRAQLGTVKQSHGLTEAVCHYPATSAIDSLITVKRFSAFAGRRRSVENALFALCHMAGVRSVSFRNLMTGSYAKAPWTGTLTSTAQSLPLISNLADFVLDLDVHLPTSGTWLRVDFRGYYRFCIRQSSAGQIQVGMQTTSGDLTADGSGDKWFELFPA